MYLLAVASSKASAKSHTMQSQHCRKAAVSSTSKAQQPDRFTLLLADVRSGLGDLWTFYEECIDGVLDAAANQQDTTAWLEQMQQLVEGNYKIAFSHEGILFLLRDMGIWPSQQQTWGEGEGNTLGMYPSPPLSPPLEGSGGPTSSCIIDTASLTAQRDTTMTSLLPHRPLRPSTPAMGNWAAPRSSLPRTQHHPQPQLQAQLQSQSQQLTQHPMYGVEPFDFSAPRQPGLTFPKDLRAYYNPPDQIVVSENYVPPPPNPLQQTSSNPVFFTDPTLRRNVVEYFAWTSQSQASDHSGYRKNNNTNINDWRAYDRLPYEPKDDDVMLWKQKLQREEEEVKATSQVHPTWPPWDFRLLNFDL